jgi:hypothetical protein
MDSPAVVVAPAHQNPLGVTMAPARRDRRCWQCRRRLRHERITATAHGSGPIFDGMDVIGLLPNLDLLRFDIGQAYLWRDGTSTTLIDTGVPGSGAAVRELVTGSLDRVVLTHFHGDHTGGAAEIREWSGAPTYAHRADAPVIRGEGTPPEPVLLDWEKPVFEQVGAGHLLTGPSVVVDHELDGAVRYSISVVAHRFCRSRATRPAASRSTCRNTGCCSPATPSRRRTAT